MARKKTELEKLQEELDKSFERLRKLEKELNFKF